jgi:hypothetical protein
MHHGECGKEHDANDGDCERDEPALRWAGLLTNGHANASAGGFWEAVLGDDCGLPLMRLGWRLRSSCGSLLSLRCGLSLRFAMEFLKAASGRRYWMGGFGNADRPRGGGFECGGHLGETPGSGDAVVDDLAEGRRQRRAGGADCWIALLGQALQEEGCEILHVTGAQSGALRPLGSFADAVAAEFDDFADGEDVRGLDVLVEIALGVQRLECGYEAGSDLAGLGEGERAFAEDLAEVGLGRLEDSVDEGRLIHHGLAKAGQGEEVRLVEVRDACPSSEDLVFVEVGLDEADDG